MSYGSPTPSGDDPTYSIELVHPTFTGVIVGLAIEVSHLVGDTEAHWDQGVQDLVDALVSAGWTLNSAQKVDSPTVQTLTSP